MATKQPYRINKIGASHSQQEATPGTPLHEAAFVNYGFGDSIMLDPLEVAKGKWSHLEPTPQIGARAKAPAPKALPKLDDDKDDEPGDDVEAVVEDTGEITAAALEALITAVEESNGKDEYAAARQKVIDAEVFEADTVPKAKAALLQALIAIRDE